MTLSAFITYCGALAVAVALPGPGLAAIVARAIGSGFRPALFMIIGLILGDLTYLTGAVFGLALLAERFGLLFQAVKWVGVGYLFWLAWLLWNKETVLAATKPHTERAGRGANITAGALIALSNPKVMMFYLALTPTLFDMSAVTPTDYLLLLLCTASVMLVVLVPYIVLAARARELLRAPAVLRKVNRFAAVCLAAAAVAIALRQ